MGWLPVLACAHTARAGGSADYPCDARRGKRGGKRHASSPRAMLTA
ncbi:hypothetical protein BUH_4236 [Burkholderia pseudomallei Pakistan 9]|nr:hypothetical protein BUH_4236 [Burkholderia pseudomallei Pakistan 9]EEP52297.1 hypothetical protein GBP346_B2661 [Burkholderia pseudomallei MSHR346]